MVDELRGKKIQLIPGENENWWQGKKWERKGRKLQKNKGRKWLEVISNLFFGFQFPKITRWQEQKSVIYWAGRGGCPSRPEISIITQLTKFVKRFFQKNCTKLFSWNWHRVLILCWLLHRLTKWLKSEITLPWKKKNHLNRVFNLTVLRNKKNKKNLKIQ